MIALTAALRAGTRSPWLQLVKRVASGEIRDVANSSSLPLATAGTTRSPG